MSWSDIHPDESFLDAPKDPNRDSLSTTTSTPNTKGVDLLTPKSSPTSVKRSVLLRGLDLFHPHHLFLGLRPRPRLLSTLVGTPPHHPAVPDEIFHAQHQRDPSEEIRSSEPRPSAELGPGYIVAKMAFSQARSAAAVPGTNARTELGEELAEVVTSVLHLMTTFKVVYYANILRSPWGSKPSQEKSNSNYSLRHGLQINTRQQRRPS
jgi:hypothetical protein